MYLPTLGRFASRDPLDEGGVDILHDNNWFGRGLDAMREQRYAYARNNPVNRVDPSGLACRPSAPPACAIPEEDLFRPVACWKPLPSRGYSVQLGNVRTLTFKGAACDCCTMDIEIVGRAYRYYRFENGIFIDHSGGPIFNANNDQRDFFSLLVLTVCKTNIVCAGKKEPDVIETLVSGPLQRDGLGVFIRSGPDDIEHVVRRFQPDDPCNAAEDLIGFVQRTARPAPTRGGPPME